MHQGTFREYEQWKAQEAAKKGTWSKIHQSPSPIDGDNRHMIETWENSATGERYFIPYYSRTGRTWAPYTGKGNDGKVQRLAFKTWAGAAGHIKQSVKYSKPKTVAHQQSFAISE